MDLNHTLAVTPKDSGRRADLFVAEALDLSRTYVQKLFDAGRVRRADKPLKAGNKLEASWTLHVSIPPPETLPLQPVDMPIDILYEDVHLAVLNKPRGLVVHPGSGTTEPTLVHGLLSRYAGTLSVIGGVERPGIVHRLDKDTSGLLIVARTDGAHREMSAQFAAAEVKKTYVALVDGTLGDKKIIEVDRPIGRDPRHRQQMAVVESGGRTARTRIESVVSTSLGTVVLAHPRTGRTHQIRVHLKSLGHPIVGDPLYGRRSPLWQGQFLHAWRLAFDHPISGQPLTFQAPLPPELQAILLGSCDPAALDRLREIGIL